MFIKRYKKTLLATIVIAAMPLMAATNKTIYVTTFDDEDGTNLSACSLREAIKTAAANKAYGGCSAGNTAASATDVIELKAGTYHLKSELAPTSSVNIFGESPVTYTAKDPITNSYPQRTELTTIIDADNNSRLFNTSTSGATISLNNLILQNANAGSGKGGALYLGASTTLNRVEILNAMALTGGAIYLDGTNQTININNSLIQNSNASVGSSVLAMSCVNNLTFVPRVITFTYSSIINNGSSTSSNTIEFCGQPSITLTANTIAQNTANPSSGSIIKFSTDSNNVNDMGKLATTSTLNLQSNTIIENNAYSTFLYDSLGTKQLAFNVLAFNSNKSCRYLPGSVATATKTGMNLNTNALNLTGTNSVCDIANNVLINSANQATAHNTVDVMDNPRSKYLSNLQAASKFTAFLPLYYPLVNDFSANTNPLVNTGKTDCSGTDQRTLARAADNSDILNDNSRNTCDIGSVEISRLTAENIVNLTNKDMVALVEGYQTQIDLNQSLLDNPDTDPAFLPFYQAKIVEFNELLNGVDGIPGTKANTHYRPIYADPFALSLPHETLLSNGTREITPLTKDNYNVTAQAVGVGTSIDNAANHPVQNLVCEWNSALQFVVMYKKTDDLAQAGDAFYCTYTLSLKSDSSIKSTGVIKSNFVNIAPVAKDDQYELRYGSDQILNVNILDNDSDLGDGPISELTDYTMQDPKPAFYKNANGVELPIHITNIPTGLLITPERSGPCPGIDSTKTCFGGKLNIQVKNNFNPFNFTFKYVVYDAEGLSSNEATVTLVNTANNIDSSKGGGGSFAWWGILALASMGLYHKRQIKLERH